MVEIDTLPRLSCLTLKARAKKEKKGKCYLLAGEGVLRIVETHLHICDYEHIYNFFSSLAVSRIIGWWRSFATDAVPPPVGWSRNLEFLAGSGDSLPALRKEHRGIINVYISTDAGRREDTHIVIASPRLWDTNMTTVRDVCIPHDNRVHTSRRVQTTLTTCTNWFSFAASNRNVSHVPPDEVSRTPWRRSMGIWFKTTALGHPTSHTFARNLRSVQCTLYVAMFSSIGDYIGSNHKMLTLILHRPGVVLDMTQLHYTSHGDFQKEYTIAISGKILNLAWDNERTQIVLTNTGNGVRFY